MLSIWRQKKGQTVEKVTSVLDLGVIYILVDTSELKLEAMLPHMIELRSRKRGLV